MKIKNAINNYVHVLNLNGNAIGVNECFINSGGSKGLKISGRTIEAYGSDANIDVQINPKGTGFIYLPDNRGVTMGSLSFNAGTSKIASFAKGTFTPYFSFSGGNTDMTHNVQHGRYTKIGNICYVFINCSLSAKGTSTGTFYLNGLPYAYDSSKVGGGDGEYNFGFASENLIGAERRAAVIKNGETRLYFVRGITPTVVVNTDVQNTTLVRCSFFYMTED